MEYFSEDIKRAKMLCTELTSGNKNAIIGVYNDHNCFFLNFIKTRLYDKSKADDVFQDFWAELIQGEIFCNYKGKASLRTYLCKILYFKVIDCNKKTNNERKKITSSIYIEKGVDKSQKTPEKEILETERENKMPLLIQEALLQLSDISPKDASFIKMRFFEKIEYRDIAVQELGKGADEEKIKTKTAAIRKQFTRDKTGSMARFKEILGRIMARENIDINDIFGSE